MSIGARMNLARHADEPRFDAAAHRRSAGGITVVGYRRSCTRAGKSCRQIRQRTSGDLLELANACKQGNATGRTADLTSGATSIFSIGLTAKSMRSLARYVAQNS